MPARRAVAGAVVLLLAGVAGCGGDGDDTDGTIAVVASLHPLAEVARRLGGDRVGVGDLTPAGAEPHDLELDVDAVARLLDADLAVLVGDGFQPALEKVARERNDGTLRVLDALGLPDDADPHVWLDPVLFARVVDEVARALELADPDGRAVYHERAAVLRQLASAVDARYRDTLATCARPLVVTAHDAFGRLATRYGLEHESIAGRSPEVEPDPRRLARLVDLVRQRGVTTVFAEPLLEDDIARTLAREAGVQVAVLDPYESLTPSRRAAGDGWEDVMDDNLAALAAALDCRSPSPSPSPLPRADFLALLPAMTRENARKSAAAVAGGRR